MDLDALLEADSAEVVETSTAALLRARLPHYEQAGEAGVRERLARLYRLVADAVRTRSTTLLVEHARRIARERFEAGFDLAEVQTAINLLEESIWERVFRGLPPGDYARALGLVSTALGVAKDALAQEYVSLASQAHAPSLDLRALFDGT